MGEGGNVGWGVNNGRVGWNLNWVAEWRKGGGDPCSDSGQCREGCEKMNFHIQGNAWRSTDDAVQCLSVMSDVTATLSNGQHETLVCHYYWRWKAGEGITALTTTGAKKG